MDKKFFQEAPFIGIEFIKQLKAKDSFRFRPSLRGVTDYGNSLSLGFSCLALKSFYMTSEWKALNKKEQEDWIKYINSFQTEQSNFPKNSYIDKTIIESYKNEKFNEKIKNFIKLLLSLNPNYNYDSKKVKLNKTINAESKQAVSTLYEIGSSNNKKINEIYFEGENIINYLNNLDWSKPWASGAQFSSVCVFSKTQNLGFDSELETFIDSIADSNTGSYFKEYPKTNREIINGAMKVISGLDWLDKEIHNPKNLIDFCLNNSPILEGCDVVDFVYVLYKCSKQVDYRKKEIVKLYENILLDIEKLFVKEDGGFSYFINKSQTHYYSVEITEGSNSADIHSTTLCIWSIIMILDILEKIDPKMNIIKP